MTDVNDEELRDYRARSESSEDEELHAPQKPDRHRSKVLSVRLNPDEFDELNRYAHEQEVPASALARGWVLQRLRAESSDPLRTVERLSQDIEQLRRELAHG